MKDITDHDVTRMMEMRGGSFASHLAVACMYADDQNLARIKVAFPDLWATYRTMAEHERDATQSAKDAAADARDEVFERESLAERRAEEAERRARAESEDDCDPMSTQP